MIDNLSRSGRRYLALWLPLLPTDRLRSFRDRPRLGGPVEPPLVLTEKVKGALCLAALDAQALRLGLVPGLTLADARSRVPNLMVEEIDPVADARLLEKLADACDRYTPLVGLDSPHGLILDITGCAALFGGEERLGHDLRARLAGIGIASRMGTADTPDAARALARHAGKKRVPPAQVSAILKSLPVSVLDIAPATALALTRAGLKQIGDLAARSTRPLAARFGEGLITQLRRVLGEEDQRFTPRRQPPACIVERPFAEPIARQGDIEATLIHLAERTALMLEERAAGGRLFEASFFRADGQVFRMSVSTGRPQRSPKIILRLFQEKLESLSDPLDPGFGFDLIRLAVPVMEPFGLGQCAFEENLHEEEDIASLVDRLTARFGRERVLRFAMRDTHDPLRVVRLLPALEFSSIPENWQKPEVSEPPQRPLHLFTPPEPIEALAEVPDGPPIRFRWRRAMHNVMRAEGPERIASEWWRGIEEVAARDYYRVEDRDGHRFWLFRCGLYGDRRESPPWFLHGLFV